MWEAKVELIKENGLWRVAVYENGKLMNYHVENLPYEKAEQIGKELQEDMDKRQY